MREWRPESPPTSIALLAAAAANGAAPVEMLDERARARAMRIYAAIPAESPCRLEQACRVALAVEHLLRRGDT